MPKFRSRAEIPATGLCHKCLAEKPVAEMVLVRLRGGIFYLRPRCKSCHNAFERGHRREWKKKYLRAWRRRNSDVDRSYWDNPEARRQNTLRAARRWADPTTRHAILIQGRLRRGLGMKVTVAEATELLRRFGQCYPTARGLTASGKKECERIRSRARRQGDRLRPIEIRMMVYEDSGGAGGEKGGKFVINPSLQRFPYPGASRNLRAYWRRKKTA